MNARGLNRPIAAPSADGGAISAANRAAEVACLHASEPRTRRVQVFGQAPGHYLLDDLFQETAKHVGRGQNRGEIEEIAEPLQERHNSP